MLIDDNNIDNFINEKLVKAYYFAEHVYIHTSTTSALEFLRNLQTTYSGKASEMIPSIIFLDINMPILDGFAFLEEYEKLDARLTKQIQIMMLTSSMNPVDIEKSNLNACVKRFIHKPLTEDQLNSIVA